MNYTLKYRNSIGEVEFSLASGIIVEQSESLTSNTTSFSTSKNANGVGVKVDSQQVEAKILSLTGTILGDATIKRRQMLNVFAPLEKSTLVFNDEFQIECYPQNTPDIEMYDQNPRFSVVLYIPAPYWQTESENMVMLMGLEPNFKFPWNISDPNPYRFSTYTQTAYTNVFNDGEYESPWEMTITATTALSNPKVENMITGEFIRIIKDIAAGESVIISTLGGEISVTCKNGDSETDGFVYLDIDSEPFVLHPGDNLLKTSAEENQTGISAIIKFRTMHSGVYL